VIANPAFGDAEFVRDLSCVQKAFIGTALLSGDIARLAKVTSYALDPEFDLWLSGGFNGRKIAGAMVYGLFAG
jgi:hypothetical protein